MHLISAVYIGLPLTPDVGTVFHVLEEDLEILKGLLYLANGRWRMVLDFVSVREFDNDCVHIWLFNLDTQIVVDLFLNFLEW
jgi:hypothetical protein